MYVSRHSVTHIWIALVSVKTTDFDFFAVKIEAILFKTALSEAEAYRNIVRIVELNCKCI